MILVDANLLLYAYHPRAEQHEKSRAWLEAVLSAAASSAFPGSRCGRFSGSPPAPASSTVRSQREAEAAISSWLGQPAAGILGPGERHWEILCDLVRAGQTAGPLVMDAVLAAMALEHGATVCTTDRDFTRFSGLRWTNPLVAND